MQNSGGRRGRGSGPGGRNSIIHAGDKKYKPTAFETAISNISTNIMSRRDRTHYQGNQDNQEKMTARELEELFAECQNDPSLLSDIDPVQIALQTDIAHHLAGKNMETIEQEVELALHMNTQEFSEEEIEKYLESLHGYSVIHNVDDLVMGRCVRWFTKHGTGPLNGGGILVGLWPLNDDKYSMKIMTYTRKFFCVTFYPGQVFQQLSRDELLILVLASGGGL
jgi:hypothetical protein